MRRGFRGRHVVVTGGTGALGTAVVGALLEARRASVMFPIVRRRGATFRASAARNVKLYPRRRAHRRDRRRAALWRKRQAVGLDSSRRRLRRGAGRKTGKADLMRQLDKNLVSCFLCCRAAVNAMKRARRPHRQRRGAPGAGMAQRRRHGGLYREQGGRCGADGRARGGSRQQGILVNAVAPSIMDTPANRKPCRKPIRAGQRSKRWRRRSCFSPHRITESPAARSCRSYGKAPGSAFRELFETDEKDRGDPARRSSTPSFNSELEGWDSRTNQPQRSEQA